MKHFKRSVAFVLALIMSVTLLPLVAQAATTKTKTVYVITNIAVKENGKTKAINGKKAGVTVTYNDNGLIKKIDSAFVYDAGTDTFTYNKNNQMTKKVSKFGDDSNTTTYTWKNGLKTKKTEKSPDYSQTTKYKYNSKDQISSSNNGHETTKYSYKKGHVIKAVGEEITYTASLDDKGNITKWTRKFNSNKIGYYKATITYNKSGRVSKLVRTFKSNPMMQEKHTQTLTFTYKKMTVPKSVADTIADQQWQLINSNTLHLDAESFAW